MPDYITVLTVEIVRFVAGTGFLAIIVFKQIVPQVKWIRENNDEAVRDFLVYFGFIDDDK